MSAIKVVVLDFDGVVLETVGIKAKAFKQLFFEYGEEAVAYIVRYHLLHGGISRFEKFKHFYNSYLGRTVSDQELQALNETFLELCFDKILAAPFVPGALEFISAAGRKWPLYIASGTPEDELHQILRHLKMDRLFKSAYGSPDKKKNLLERVLDLEAVAPEQALMVGDSMTDLEAASAVGMNFYGRGHFEGYPCAPDLTGLMGFTTAFGSDPCQ